MTSCYTSKKSLDELEKIFKETASIFDLIMIDDFCLLNVVAKIV